jgi:arginase family enzyme
VLDPAHAPGTAVPEPGGLTTRELQLLLRGLGDLPIVGADIIESAPLTMRLRTLHLAVGKAATRGWWPGRGGGGGGG